MATYKKTMIGVNLITDKEHEMLAFIKDHTDAKCNSQVMLKGLYALYDIVVKEEIQKEQYRRK